MSDLPAGWIGKTLGEITTIRNEKRSPKEIPELPFIGLEEVEAHTGEIISVKTTSGLKSAVAIFDKGDVLYARLRPYLNKVVIPNFAGAASAEFIAFATSSFLEPRYLQRVLMSPEFISFTALKSTGDRPRVTYESISSYKLPLPPLPEQRRIVAKIDILSEKSKRAREHLGHIPRLVEKYKQAILAQTFGRGTEDGLTALSEVIASTFYGPRFAKEAYDSSGVITLRTTDFDDDGHIKPKSPPAVRVSKEEFGKWGLVDGDILVTRTGSIGKCAQYENVIGPALPSAYLIRVRLLLKRVRPRFVLLFLLSETGQSQLGLGITAVTQPNINAGVIERLRLPIPDLETQDRAIRSQP